MDFQKIDSFEMNINTNQKNYLLTAKVKKEGDFIILKAEIKRRGSSPYHKTQLKMVLLKGRENIPLLMNVFASGVFINMRLSEAE